MLKDPSAVIATFNELLPTPWSEIPLLSPIERAKRFFLPSVDDRENVSIAQRLIIPLIRNERDLPTCRLAFKNQTSFKEEIDEPFNITAHFYRDLLNAARDMIDGDPEAIREMWPSVKYENLKGEDCCERCSILEGKNLLWRSPTFRRFYPPWHLSCRAWVTDCEETISSEIPAECEGDDQYLCNPIDFLVAFGFIDNF